MDLAARADLQAGVPLFALVRPMNLRIALPSLVLRHCRGVNDRFGDYRASIEQQSR